MSGPSPRGRGTRPDDGREAGDERAIPARAGNARFPARCRTRRAGHPRAGGERFTAALRARRVLGPSPRGRGTQRGETDDRQRHRAIPARAGNARRGAWRKRARSGHPRAGGERSYWCGVLESGAGPSPRGRGTRRAPGVPLAPIRAIPARAGNAPAPGGCPRGRSGHPRAGGERAGESDVFHRLGGPSPRGRGTRMGARHDRRPRRAIPARAGNANFRVSRPHRSPGHPRAGGERGAGLRGGRLGGGPSPRGRGTRGCGRCDGACRRAIPARAGNAPGPGRVI